MYRSEEEAGSSSSGSSWRLWMPERMVKRMLTSGDTPGLFILFLSLINSTVPQWSHFFNPN